MNSNWQLLRIPILNSRWLQKVLGHENEDGYNSVKNWALDIDYKKYLPKMMMIVYRKVID